ncbi:urease accessory protein UreD [Belnapia rosea]|uniref:Urease accessory protein UreD n=1 Tax=Belnapia rosea TaxID=938405 RepID=A0A1G6T2B7_9PROT|nr:urease accessory protein UreD [Belnapia rosea]SDD22627.1 urease accessory protein [Belnapia rosea]
MPRDAPAAPSRHQRADGAFELGFGTSPRGTVLRTLFQQAPLRLLFPDPEPGEPPTAALLNCAGGLAGGDALRQAVRLEPGARATLCTAAAEKVYRSLGPATRIETRLSLGAGAVLEWLPQETILFDGARMTRRMRAELAEGARLLAAEMLVFGRAAAGERMRRGAVLDSWRLAGPDGLLWADALSLDAPAEQLAAPFGFGGAEAMATLLLAAPEAEAMRDLLRTLPEQAPGAATLPRPGLLLARWLGGASAVRRATRAAIAAIRGAALGLPPRLPRLWTT